MKRTLVILTILLLLAPMSRATSTAHLKANVATMADSAYRASDYAAAIELYESVLAEGFTSADLYYNLGNAYYRTDQMGLAILNYERALRLNPSMSDARDNLALTDSKTVDRITPLPKLFIVRWVDFLCTRFTPEIWRVVWIVLLVLVGCSIVLMRLGSRRGLRKTGLAIGLFCLILLVVTTLLLLDSTRRYNAHNQAVILQQAIVVKSSPEIQSTDKMVLHEGTKLIVNDSLANWYKITIADGTTGWCQKESVERI